MNEPYVKINLILALIVIAVFTYCFFLPDLAQRGATVPSSCEGMPFAYCKSRGLSRAFSAILHGELSEARRLNPLSISIFTFFAVQFVARLALIFLFLRTRNSRMTTIDAVTSSIYFLIVFSRLIS